MKIDSFMMLKIFLFFLFCVCVCGGEAILGGAN